MCQRRSSNSRWVRLYQGLSGREILSRREAMYHRRGDKRNPAAGDRQAAIEGLASVLDSAIFTFVAVFVARGEVWSKPCTEARQSPVKMNVRWPWRRSWVGGSLLLQSFLSREHRRLPASTAPGAVVAGHLSSSDVLLVMSLHGFVVGCLLPDQPAHPHRESAPTTVHFDVHAATRLTEPRD